MPEMFSNILANFQVNTLPFLIVAQSLSFWFFISNCKELTKEKEEILKEETVTKIIYFVIFMFLLLFCPIRSCINCICGKEVEEVNAEN